MFIPLKDLNPRRTVPVLTVLLILLNVAVFVYQVTLPPRAEKAFLLAYSDIPIRLPAFFSGHATWQAALLPWVTSMFLHAGILHLAGNMLFLWIFGDNVEDFFGHLGYLLFYLVCGTAAGLLHTFTNLQSNLPALGASGAISGVMGAYMVLYPRSRVLTLIFIFLVPIPAVIILGWWFVLQFLGGLSSVGMHAAGGVAWWAHVGGFLMGVLLTLVLRSRKSHT
jgi:membrane associated rhomboid family serine protease